MRRRSAAAVAALAGCATMSVELAAVRVLAPHFGDSAYVWTNVIGVILAAMAIGAWTGGAWSARPASDRWLPRLFGLAALILAIVPLLGPALGSWLVPQELPLDAAMPALVRGSLVATVVLFAPPVWLLGAVSPLLVTAVVRGGGQVGAAVGAVSAAGTIGSLVGTFATTHLAVPELGCRLTIWVCALLLLLCAGLVRGQRSGRAAAVTAALVVLALGTDVASVRTSLNGALPPLQAPPAGTQLLAERESRQQYLQVVRDPQAPGGALTALRINEGLDSFHSVAIDGSVLTGGRYYDWHAVVPLLAGDGRRPADLRALSIGDAGGSFRRIYAGVHPMATVDAVEIDAATVSLGDRHFAGRKAPGDVFVLDGRVFVERSTRQWHVIHVDAYAHQVYVPAHLASQEFFAAARLRLLPGGVIACNVGGLRLDDPVLVKIAASMRTVFGASGEVVALQVPRSRNFVLLGRDRPFAAEALAQFQFGDERLVGADLDQWRAIVAAVAAPSALQPVPATGPYAAPLGDDRPELDLLLHRSYVRADDPAAVVDCVGDLAVAAAEADAFAALQAGDFPAVLRRVGQARAATAYLRLLAGDARWQLRQLQAAKAEYDAGAALPGDTTVAATLSQRQHDLAAESGPRERAREIATRNGWLAAASLLAAGAAALAGAWLTRRA